MRTVLIFSIVFTLLACNNEPGTTNNESASSDTPSEEVLGSENPSSDTPSNKEAQPLGPVSSSFDSAIHGGASKKWYISKVNAYSGGNLENLFQSIASKDNSVKPSITFESDYSFTINSGSDLLINCVWHEIPISTNSITGTWEIDESKQFLKFMLVLEEKEENRRGKLTLNCPYSSMTEQLIAADINLQFLGDHFQYFTGNFELSPAD